MAIERSKIDIQISNEIIPIISALSVGKTLDDKINVSIAIGLFAGKKVTLARAAELAGVSLGEFIDILRNQGIPWGEYTEEQERMDDIGIQSLLGRMEEKND